MADDHHFSDLAEVPLKIYTKYFKFSKFKIFFMHITVDSIGAQENQYSTVTIIKNHIEPLAGQGQQCNPLTLVDFFMTLRLLLMLGSKFPTLQ